MSEAGITETTAGLMSMDLHLRRPWHLLNEENVKFLNGVVTPEAVIYSLIRANMARRHAASYRMFNVGACGIVFRNDGSGRSLEHGANIKNGAGVAEVDKHAEKFIMDEVNKGDKLGALSVVAPLQEDSGSGKETPTLHPCYKCRQEILAGGQATENTLIVCANPGFTAVQWGGVKDFIGFHADKDNQLQTALFDETPELFRPTGLKPGEPIHLSDELDVDTVEWDRKVTFPLWKWIRQHQVNT